MSQPNKKNTFKTEIPVLIQHINLGNHLGHDSLVSILQEARARFLRTYGLSEEKMILTELHVKYTSEAFYGETLEIELTAQSKGPIRLEFSYTVLEKNSKRLVAKASTTMAFYDYDKKKVYPPPKELSLAD